MCRPRDGANNSRWRGGRAAGQGSRLCFTPLTMHPEAYASMASQLAAPTGLKALSDAVTATLMAQAARAEQVGSG